MGAGCTQVCQQNELDDLNKRFEDNNNNITPTPEQTSEKLKSAQKKLKVKANREKFNSLFNKQLPYLGKLIEDNEFNSLIPEKIKNYMMQNIYEPSKNIELETTTFEQKPVEFKNGNIYKGEWNEDAQMEGNGQIYLKNDNVFAEGIWYKGILKDGRVYLPNGDIYEGDINNSTFNGKGKLIYEDGTIYYGDFVDGIKEGKGEIKFNDGCWYKGDFYQDMMEGSGEFNWKEGYNYKGDVKENQLEGNGIIFKRFDDEVYF